MKNSALENRELLRRLQNCIQTILDFRDALKGNAVGAVFMPEMTSLERFLDELSGVVVSESEVRKVELATDNFLKELAPLMKKCDKAAGAGKHFQ